MAKTRRGSGIRHLYVDPNGNVHEGVYNNGRGTCPACKRTGVKVLPDHYSLEVGEETVVVCKRCYTAIGRGKIKLPGASQATEATEAAEAAEA